MISAVNGKPWLSAAKQSVGYKLKTVSEISNSINIFFTKVSPYSTCNYPLKSTPQYDKVCFLKVKLTTNYIYYGATTIVTVASVLYVATYALAGIESSTEKSDTA